MDLLVCTSARSPPAPLFLAPFADRVHGHDRTEAPGGSGSHRTKSGTAVPLEARMTVRCII